MTFMKSTILPFVLLLLVYWQFLAIAQEIPINLNGGFEETPVGITGGDIIGWELDLNKPAQAVFEVVDDSVKEGNHALKIEATNLGGNDWDIQAINRQFTLEPNIPYRYSIWAKADKNNTFTNFTVGEFYGSTFYEWLGAYAIPLTTDWQEYSFDFVAQTNTGRSLNHFSLSANSTSLPIKFYIDDLRIVKLDLSVGIENDPLEIPTEFLLSQNYPNPFNPSTVISYQLVVGSHISLKIYDVLGNEVATLVNEEKPAGTYEMDFDASALSSGVYSYKIEAGDFVQTKKMILLR